METKFLACFNRQVVNPDEPVPLAGTHTHAGPALGEQKLQRWFPAIERY